MSRIKLVTDSSADISASHAHELGIEVVPLYLNIGEQVYRAGIDIGNDQFYQAMSDGRFKTGVAAPPQSAFEQVYRRLTPDYDHIFSIHLSARLGGVYKAAQQARGKLPASATKVEVIDSKLTSMALGMVVTHAAEAVRAGLGPNETSLLINALIQHCHMVFFVDTIEHLEAGGQLTLGAAVLGSMSRIKPLLLLDEGEIVPYERTRTRAKAIEGLFTFVEDFPAVKEVIALYTTTPEDIEKLLEKVDPIFPRDRVGAAQIGASFGVHLGVGAMGVAVFEGLDGVVRF